MKIRMSEIPNDGESFEFDKKSGELNKVLSDLTRDDYKINVTIQPRDAFYELRGQIFAQLPDLCSQCGDDMVYKVDRKFNDVLMEKLSDSRTGRYSKTAGVTDQNASDSEVAYFEAGVFDLGEYIHEVLALGTNDYPLCGGDHCANIETVEAYMTALNQESEKFDDDDEEAAKKSPFAALKDLKLN